MQTVLVYKCWLIPYLTSCIFTIYSKNLRHLMFTGGIFLPHAEVNYLLLMFILTSVGGKLVITKGGLLGRYLPWNLNWWEVNQLFDVYFQYSECGSSVFASLIAGAWMFTQQFLAEQYPASWQIGQNVHVYRLHKFKKST